MNQLKAALAVAGLTLLTVSTVLRPHITQTIPQVALADSIQATSEATYADVGDLLVPGLALTFNPLTTEWRWKYAVRFADGCMRLQFTNDPLIYDQAHNSFVINLISYQSDDFCKQPSAVRSLSGHLHATTTSTFAVFLDGKQVTNYSNL